MISALKPVSVKKVDDIYLNIAHFLDHFMMLIFAKAAYDAGRHFGMSYDEIIVYGVAGFVLFGGMAPVAAQLADKFSRSLLMVTFHFGIGGAAILAAFTQTVWQLAVAIGLIGTFAAIYHPVGIAMLIKSNRCIGFRLGINGVFGNMGVAAAPLIAGFLLTMGDWRLCFILPGLFCLGYGVAFIAALREDGTPRVAAAKTGRAGFAPNWKLALGAMLLSTASGGFIFGAMTFVVPRYFEISMTNISTSVALTGLLASLVYATASFTQIGVGWVIDRLSPKWVLFTIGIGQVLFIFLASRFTDYALFLAMVVAMSFVFGQIPITDTILSRYVPDEWRAKALSVKFMVNLTIGAMVLPICGAILQSGVPMSSLFIVMSAVAILVALSGLLLPVQADDQRRDKILAE
uniref:Permeases of the major facilitator superfamily n=1 Tax=uncultured bacterium HF0070_11A08 TaxID=710812 RepID=E0XPF9_9BACT|nr:permeases of the major facilitator superfamily [uncultured bacterium HF0070_11A08]